MNKLGLITVFVVPILFSTLSHAATYYVDNLNGKDSNAGTSETSPWKSIARVNSFNFKPGDNILFRRSQEWKEMLAVKQSGTSAYPIIFGSFGIGALPVIDGSMTRKHGISIYGRSYIIIKDFKIQNTAHASIRINNGRYVTVRNSEMYVTGHGGVFVEESSNCLIINNKMTTPSAYYPVQTDGIYAQRNSNNIYEGNHIVISNQHPDPHCDAIQFYLETSATVKNNYVEQNNEKTNNAQGIYCSENSGLFRIYNNVAVSMHTKSSVIKFKNVNTTGRVEIVGNTMYGGKGALLQTNDPYIVFKNNIVVTAGSYPVISFDKAVNNKSDINYNLYKREGTGTIAGYAGESYTMNEWKTEGYDVNGIEADPKFTSVSLKNFTLVSGSPALDKGVNLNAPYNTDIIGTLRPYAGATDIGAYEMKIKADDDYLTIVNSETSIPEIFELSQNYPNPFNPSTSIKFAIPENSNVSLKIYDITGSEVTELINDFRNAGIYEVKFDATDLASGTYIYILKAKDFVQTKKMILLK